MSAPGVRPMTRLIALPFRVLRPDAETDFLAFSLPDAITSSLAGTRNLLVRSSAAAARFDPQAPDLRKLAADADVDVALMGTILRAGSQLRATAQLVEAPAGTVVWSHASQHPLQDVFALQDELVGGIVALAVAVAGRSAIAASAAVTCRATPSAYELYLRGNELARDWDRIPEAREVYQRCVDARLAVRAGVGRAGPLPARDRQVLRGCADGDRRGRASPSSAPSASIPTCRSCTSTTPSSSAMPAAAVDAMRRLLRRAQAAVDPEHFAGLVHACRYVGLARRVGGGARGSAAPRPDHPDQRAQHLPAAVRLRADRPRHRRLATPTAAALALYRHGPQRRSPGGAGGACRADAPSFVKVVGRDDPRLPDRRARGA